MTYLGDLDEGLDKWRELLNQGNELVLELDQCLDDLVGSKKWRSELLIEGDDSIHNYPVFIHVVADKFVHVEIEESWDDVFTFSEEIFIELDMDSQDWDVHFEEKEAILRVLTEGYPLLQ